MATINLATKYSDKVAERFYQDSVVINHTSKEWDFDGVKSVNIYSVKTYPTVDYTRGTVQEAVGDAGNANQYYSRYGSVIEVEDTIQTLTITQDKAVSLAVDKGNNEEQMMIKNAGKVIAREQREVFMPEMERYALKVWANYTGVQKDETGTALTKSNIVEAITKGMTALGNKNALNSSCYLYIPWTTFGLLLNSPEFLNLEKLGNKALGQGVIGQVRGLNVVAVPDDYMPAGYSTTKANFMIVNEKSVLAPTKFKDIKLHTNPQGISGALMEIRWLYDAFVIDARKDGVFVNWNGQQSE